MIFFTEAELTLLTRFTLISEIAFNPKKAEGLIPLCGFSKNLSSKERVKLCFFVAFDITKSHILSENFIEIPQVVQKI